MPEIKAIWLHAHNIIRSARQTLNRELQPLGLTSAEGNILLHLLTQGDDMAQEQLVAQLDVSKPAVSRTLNLLEAQGYLIREPDPADRRAHLIHLTDKTRQIGPTLEQIYNHIYTLAVQGISPQELDYFINLFDRISENFARDAVKEEKEKKEERDAL
jgi:DNA-binding MarR family transcriptional regulator